MKLRDLAARLDCRLDGDGDIDIARVAGIHDAGPGDVTFLANPKYEKALAGTRASAVILHTNGPAAPCATLSSPEPYLAFARAVGLFAPDDRPATGVHPMTAVAADARLGADVSIGPFAVIGAGATIGHRTVVYPNVTIGPGVRIGDDCVIHANVSIRERVSLGHRVVLQDGVVLGGDGYGFVRRSDGTHEKIPQVAGVVIEDDVEIGANTTVDRPAVGETRIKAGAKIDNLVQIAHGVTIGRNALMAAQVGISGSTTIGDDVIFGGQVGVGGHLTIGKGAIAVGQSGVTNSLEPGARVAGYPAIDNRAWRRASVLFKHLPELKKRIDALAAEIANLKKKDPDLMMRTLWLAAVFAAAASTATAQSIQLAPLENAQAPSDNPEGAVVWLPNYHFHLNMAHLSNDVPRYNWDANYGGELGIVAVGRTQLTFVANYQAVLGEEFHPFDPNQGNYTIDGVLSTRVKGVYVAGVFHHLSRHLADRAKRPPVDWNMFGGRVGRLFTHGGTDVEARADLLGVILKTNVDYDWELHAGVRVHHRVYGTFGLIGSAMLRAVGTNGVGNRGTQTGGRGEGGLRVSGKAATVELYLAVERVIDPYPTEFGTTKYASVGMRLLSR